MFETFPSLVLGITFGPLDTVNVKLYDAIMLIGLGRISLGRVVLRHVVLGHT